MITLYRIALDIFADLEGIGGITTPGRWNNAGQRVAYLSQSVSLAALEKLMNLSSVTLLPDNLVVMEVLVPDGDVVDTPTTILVKGWDDYPYIDETMDFGSQFLKENKHLLLKVPSAVTYGEFNYLLNPRHVDLSRCQISRTYSFEFDKRLGDKF